MTATGRGPDVRRLLRDHGLRPSRALGQHFVVDPNTLRRIVRLAGVAAGTPVVEVGAGLGSLTLALAGAGHHVVAVEVDRGLAAAVREVVAPSDVEVVEADALRLDWQDLLGPADRRWALVANLPYNVATPVVVRVLEEAPQVESLLVMVQREAGKRMAAVAGDPAYGAVSVKIAYWAQASIVGRVPATVFFPRPRVESVLVRIDRRPERAVPLAAVTYHRLFEVVRAGFSQRRKMLRGSLAGVVDREAFAGCGVAEDARAEDLSVEQWGRLAAWHAAGTAEGPGEGKGTQGARPRGRPRARPVSRPQRS